MQTKETLAELYRLSPATVEAALDNLANGQAVVLAFSGKRGSGKDTVGAAVYEELQKGGQGSARSSIRPLHASFAELLRDEVDDLITMVSNETSTDPTRLVLAATEKFSVPPVQAALVIGALWSPTRWGDHGLTSRSRTPEVRFVLQYWGTEVRRRQDEGYWIRPTMAKVLEAAAQGRGSYITDVRYLNEAEACKGILGYTVRLDITEAEQRRRLAARDAAQDAANAGGHASETVLDDWDGFDLRINNSGPMGPTITAVLDLVASRRGR